MKKFDRPTTRRYFASNIPLLYVNNPKAGCTAVFDLIDYLDKKSGNGRSIFKLPVVRLQTPTPRNKIYNNLYKRITENEVHFHMTFVRNPYVRLLSAYLDKIQNFTASEQQFLNPRERALDLAGKTSYDQVKFEDFVNMISTENPLEMNPHWRLQTVNIDIKNINYDFIGRLERFDEDIALLFGDEAVDFAEAYQIQHKTDAVQKLMEFYTPGLADEVYKIYREDFEILGYYKDVENAWAYEPSSNLPRAKFRPKSGSATVFFHVMLLYVYQTLQRRGFLR